MDRGAMPNIEQGGSLEDGLEIVTHPMSLDYQRTHMPWEALCRKAISLGYLSHRAGTCGLHVHVSRDAFGQTERWASRYGYRDQPRDILDHENSLYFVRGNNPLALYHFSAQGRYLYASTQEILDKAMEKMTFPLEYKEPVDLVCGEILKVDARGSSPAPSLMTAACGGIVTSPTPSFQGVLDFTALKVEQGRRTGYLIIPRRLNR